MESNTILEGSWRQTHMYTHSHSDVHTQLRTTTHIRTQWRDQSSVMIKEILRCVSERQCHAKFGITIVANSPLIQIKRCSRQCGKQGGQLKSRRHFGQDWYWWPVNNYIHQVVKLYAALGFRWRPHIWDSQGVWLCPSTWGLSFNQQNVHIAVALPIASTRPDYLTELSIVQ